MQSAKFTHLSLVRAHKTIFTLITAVVLASGFFVSTAFGAGGGGDPCADGVPNAYLMIKPSTKGVGSLDVTFDGSYSKACTSPIVSYEWDFGDGTSVSGVTASHQYQVGTFNPSLTITDAAGLTNTLTHYTDIIVKADNQAPTLGPIALTVAQGESNEISIAGNATDPDGDDISRGFFFPGVNGTSEVLTPKGTMTLQHYAGTISFRARPDASGQQTVAIGIRDGFGGEALSTITITVEPRLTAVNDTVQTYRNTPITVAVKANDFSYQDAPFDITWLGGSNNSYVSLNPDKTVTFSPAWGFVGTASFQYSISTAAPYKYYSSYGTVTVEILPPLNNSPAAVGDSLNLNEDTSGSLNVLANDSDQDGDSLSAAIAGGPQHGTASLSTLGVLNYQPQANYNGSDSVSYVVTDSKGATSTASVAITVRSVNDAPVAVSDSSSTSEDNGVVVNVLANDSDIENGNLLAVQIAAAPTNGTATVNANGTVTYSPKANYYGTDSFTYRATDANGASSLATVNMTVSSVNDGPSAIFSGSLAKSGTATFDASGSKDIDGQIVSYKWNFGDGQTATTTGPSTSHKYANKNGSYQVTLTITDNQGTTATYTKQI